MRGSLKIAQNWFLSIVYGQKEKNFVEYLKRTLDKYTWADHVIWLRVKIDRNWLWGSRVELIRINTALHGYKKWKPITSYEKVKKYRAARDYRYIIDYIEREKDEEFAYHGEEK